MVFKDTLYKKILVNTLLIFFLTIIVQAQDEVIVRPNIKTPSRNIPALDKSENKKPLTPQEKYELAKARHLALQDEKTRMQILRDIKMTNDYYDKQKESKFVKWIKWQKFKLKRKGIL